MKFDDVIEKYARLINSAVRRVCRDRHASLVEDAEQEVRMALWKLLETGKNIEYPTSYIYKVALTTGLAIVERAERQIKIVDELAAIPVDSDVDVTVLTANWQIVQAALETLSENQRNAVRAYLSGLSHVEIGELFDWTPSSARHNVYRGIEKLKKAARADTAEDE